MNKNQKEIHKTVFNYLSAIKKIGLPEMKIYFCLIGLAYEYFLVDLNEEAVVLLSEIPEKYFTNCLFQDRQENQDFDEICNLVFKKLIEVNSVDSNLIIKKMKGYFYV